MLIIPQFLRRAVAVFTFFVFTGVALSSTCASADNFQTQAFPRTNELFKPLQADPTELHFAVEVGVPRDQRTIARVAVGDYLGLTRWGWGERGGMQLSVGGAIFSRFDFTASHDLQVIDYYGNVPLDVRVGPVSNRFLFYHDSSHLGDDYLREKNLVSENRSFEALKDIFSLDISKALRLYGGVGRAIHVKEEGWKGKRMAQGGLELKAPKWPSDSVHAYAAGDVQSWERSDWNPTYNAQLGFEVITSRGQRGLSYYLAFASGPRLEDQFFDRRETYGGIGLRFHLN